MGLIAKINYNNSEKLAPKPSLVKRVAREMLTGRDNVLFDRVTGVLRGLMCVER